MNQRGGGLPPEVTVLPAPPPPPPYAVMPPPLATLEQLGARLGQSFPVNGQTGEPTTADGMRAGAALNDASNLIRAIAGEDWLDDTGAVADVPYTIQTITLSVAQRAYVNPNGAVQASVGDASVTWSREGAAGAVFLTPTEIKAIRRIVGAPSMSSIQLVTEVVPQNGRDNLYAPDPDGGDPIPLGPIPWET
jgi:hypothetical protein